MKRSAVLPCCLGLLTMIAFAFLGSASVQRAVGFGSSSAPPDLSYGDALTSREMSRVVGGCVCLPGGDFLGHAGPNSTLGCANCFEGSQTCPPTQQAWYSNSFKVNSTCDDTQGGPGACPDDEGPVAIWTTYYCVQGQSYLNATCYTPKCAEPGVGACANCSNGEVDEDDSNIWDNAYFNACISAPPD